MVPHGRPTSVISSSINVYISINEGLQVTIIAGQGVMQDQGCVHGYYCFFARPHQPIFLAWGAIVDS
jgi:hypothetical protein